MPLYRLLYKSEISLSETAGPIDEQIQAIVAAAHRANADNNLTGALIASNGVFIQALEGPMAALEATFEKICTDLRHRNARLIELAAAEDRVFPDWKMVRVDDKEDAAHVFASISSKYAGRLDVSKTSAVIQFMRTMLMRNATIATSASDAP